MEHNEELTVHDICIENTHNFSKKTKQEEDEDDTDNVTTTDEQSELLPTTMLTPPPTGEPLLNGSSRSSTSGNDLQQDFTVDELTQSSSPVLSSPHTDEGNSNQSVNSDSVDSKLVINEGSIDSTDISNTVYSKMLDTPTDVHLVDDVQCESTQSTVNEADQNGVRDQMSDQQLIPEEVIPPTPEHSTRNDQEKEMFPIFNNTDINSESALNKPTITEKSKNVPSQSMNGVVCQDNEFSSTQRLANETHTEHRKLKRKLSEDTVESPHGTSQKQTKLNNQTNSIEIINNQIALDDSTSNRVVDHDQITGKCDNLRNFNVQTSQDQPVMADKSQECADENFESDLQIDDLLSVTKDKSLDECDHIYMNGHTGNKTESSTEAPQEYKQPLICNLTDNLDDNIQLLALKSKVKLPLETKETLQTETHSCDNNEQQPNVRPDNLKTLIQPDRFVDKSQKIHSVHLDISNKHPTNLTQIPSNYGRVSKSPLNKISINITPCVKSKSNKKSLNLAKETTRLPNNNTTTIQAQTQHIASGKKINTHMRLRRQVFLCSACGSYFEKWNLFYHIREIHNKFICLFENCLGIFPNAERLVNHLESKHVHKPFVYEHKDDLLRSLRNQCFLMCCVCEHIFTENDDVTAHSCETFMKPCSVCGLKFIHKSNCGALLSNKSTKHKHKHTTVATNPVQQVILSMTHSNNLNNISQQTFLRNALLGQEPRTNHYSDYQHVAGPTQIPMFDHRLNNIPSHHIQPHLHTQTTPPQPPPQIKSQPVSIATMNGNVSQQSLTSKLYMGPNDQPSPNFYHSNQLANNNANMYHPHVNNVPYQNLPNGQYGPSQLDSRFSNINTNLNRNSDAPTNMGIEIERLAKTHKQDQSNINSNSECSSDSDDSNNHSDSSSVDSDAGNKDKENNAKRVIKPFRINLNNSKNNILTGHALPYAEEQNDNRANEGDIIDNSNNGTNIVEDNKCHPNMSDITNIQMRLDSIQQQMHAMQRNKESQTLLKVPKLTLKLSKPFQNPVESEESSTESDSDSENENENDDEENVSHNQGNNTSNDVELNEDEMEQKKTTFSQQPEVEIQHCSNHANESILTASNDNSLSESLNEIESLGKNTSTDLDESSIRVEQNEYHQQQQQHQEQQQQQHHQEPQQQQEIPILSQDDLNQFNEKVPQIQVVQEQTTDIEQTNIVPDVSNMTNINRNFSFINPPLEHNQNVMTPPDSILDGHAETENEHQTDVVENVADMTEENQVQINVNVEAPVVEDKRPITEFILDQPLDRIPIKNFIRKCLQFTYSNCLYCNHARSIAVNGVSLAEHLVEEHRFTATVDSITAEELLPETIEQKISNGMEELADTFLNMDTYDSKNVDPDYKYVKHFECFQCRFFSPIYKDLYLHNRKMHLRSALICLMCRSNFYSYSELVCHMCPGAQTKLIPIDLKFRCVLCNLDEIPSAFRLMVHLRKKHSACDVCLEECNDQSKLSCHVWKHKLHHLCYRCNITYRNKVDITRHLFWKHGTESVICKRCLEKKWPHVYHFCVPPVSFKCEVCNLTFSKALALKIHKRLHDPESISYACTLDDCDQKFISKKLMIKHISLHYMPELPPPSEEKMLQVETGNILSRDEQEASLGANSPSHSPTTSKEIEQEAPIDAVISVIEHDAREREEQKKLLKKESSNQSDLSGERSQKNKPKKLKKHRSDFSDLLDLPSVNLSESDSSEDSDTESNAPQDPSAENSKHSLCASSAANELDIKSKCNPSALDDDDDKAVMLEADIWENFKNYQANQMQEKTLNNADEERLIAENPVLLHVSQSDHDYPMMYKPLVKKSKVTNVEQITSFVPIIEENQVGDIKITFIAPEPSTKLNPQSPAPLPSSTVTIIDEELPKAENENVVANTVEKMELNEDVKEGKPDKKPDDSDSSSDSSDSDSSCSCGSNCSCTSSSSSSSSSSSDSGSNSSSSEGKRKKVLTKTRTTPERSTPEKKVMTSVVEHKEEDQQRSDRESAKPEVLHDPNVDLKPENGETEAAQGESETVDVEKPSDMDVVDVVTNDKKVTQPNIYTMVVESDLETTESETDEEFYDEHPQKLSIQMLAEKRQQLMLQTLNPVNGMPYMSTSRPSTPLLPEELAKGLKTKTKKRRRIHKNSRSPQKQLSTNNLRQNPYKIHKNSNILLPIQTPIEAPLQLLNPSVPLNPETTPYLAAKNDELPQINPNVDALQSTASAPVNLNFEGLLNKPASLPHKQHLMRLSTSSCSDADSSLKRSKRRRIPNKFYGYTSDEESMSAASTLNSSYQNPFKPTPPPNLTWSKEDLPKPSKNNRTGTMNVRIPKSIKTTKQRKIPLKGSMKTSAMKNRTLAKIKEKMRMSLTPTVPKIIIRGIPRPPQPKAVVPDLSNASRVPNAPVHHMSPPKLNNDQSDQTSDSDSDDNLHISQTSRVNLNNSVPLEESNKLMSRQQSQTYQMPFIRPDHTLLPPKRFSLSPSPPPAPFSSQQHAKEERPLSNLLSTIPQQLFNGEKGMRNDSSLYCYCRRPYDEMSEMIACDAQDCSIEWFHFECVGIKGTDINPQDKWFCPQCKARNTQTNYMTANNVSNTNANHYAHTSLDLV